MSTISDAMQAGLDYHRAGRLLDAEKMYRRVLEMYPRHAMAVHLLGLLAYQVGKDKEAVEHISAAMKLDQFNATFPADLAEVYRALGQIPEAVAACQKALELNPASAEVRNCLGLLREAEGNLDGAMGCFREAIELNPQLAAGHANLGKALLAVCNYADAQVAYEAAIRLVPDNADHYLGLGISLYEQGRPLDAIACYQKSLQLKPGYYKARHNCGLARLSLGDFANGLAEFESRLSAPALVRTYPLPRWTGAASQGGTVLVHGEQGFGDVMQFIRYVPLVAKRAAKVYVDVPQDLLMLLSDSGYENLVVDGFLPADCQYEVPMMSLPLVLGTTLETVPAQVPYLSAREELVRQWGQRIAVHPGFRVGIQWQGRPEFYKDATRSIPLRQFAALARVGGVQLFSLQQKVGTEQLGSVSRSFTVHDLEPVSEEPTAAFTDSAALIKNLDLVVTSDTAMAHLAGALGVPVWVALSNPADWRWMRDRADSPWYPTMRLFRQRQCGVWDNVFAEMAAELAQIAAR